MLLVHRVALGRAVDLARGDEHEPFDGGLPDRVEQDLRALDVGRHELGGALDDRLLDVGLGGGVDDHVDARDELPDEVRVADVAVDEREARMADQVGEVLEVPCIGQRVERDDVVLGVLEQVPDEVRRDEPGSAGDEDALHGSELSIDEVEGAVLHDALDSAEMLADEREDVALDAEDGDDERAQEQRPGEVLVRDPVDDPVGAERERGERAHRAEEDPRPSGSAAARTPRAREARAASVEGASSARRRVAARGRRRPRRRWRRRRARAPS